MVLEKHFKFTCYVILLLLNLFIEISKYPNKFDLWMSMEMQPYTNLAEIYGFQIAEKGLSSL